MIIGISGLAGSGKDTCADFLVGRYGFVKVSFADPMKKIAREVFGFSDEQLWGPSEARNAPDTRYPREHGPFVSDKCACCGFGFDLSLHSLLGPNPPPCYLTPRFALQQLGTAWGRTCYPNVWVEYAIRTAEALSDGHHAYDSCSFGGSIYEITRPAPSDVVIPDVRFKNEVDRLRAAGAYLVRIVRPGAGLSGSAGQHVSETEQASMPNEMFDAVIQNDLGLRALEEEITDLVRDWGDR